MKKTTIIMILTFLIFLPYCKNAEKPTVEEIVLEEKPESANVKCVFEKKIPIPGIQYPFLHLTDDELYIYGYSIKEQKKVVLNIYNKDLTDSSQRFFNMGQGPGDLGSGSFFYKFADSVYVPDNTQLRINIFDNQFKFIKFTKSENMPLLSPTFIKNGEYFIAGSSTFDERREITYNFYIVKFPDLDKKKFHTFGPIPLYNAGTKKFAVGSVPEFYFFYKNEKIYFINMLDYRISLFDINGQLQKSVRVNVEKKKVPGDKKVPWLKEQEGNDSEKFELTDTIQPASWMIPLGKGFVVVRRPGYGTDCNGLVEADYFDYQLNLIGKTEFPCFYWIYELRRGYFPKVYEYGDGYLYLVKEGEEEYYVEKWKVME